MPAGRTGAGTRVRARGEAAAISVVNEPWASTNRVAPAAGRPSAYAAVDEERSPPGRFHRDLI